MTDSRLDSITGLSGRGGLRRRTCRSGGCAMTRVGVSPTTAAGRRRSSVAAPVPLPGAERICQEASSNKKAGSAKIRLSLLECPLGPNLQRGTLEDGNGRRTRPGADRSMGPPCPGNKLPPRKAPMQKIQVCGPLPAAPWTKSSVRPVARLGDYEIPKDIELGLASHCFGIGEIGVERRHLGLWQELQQAGILVDYVIGQHGDAGAALDGALDRQDEIGRAHV